jgi:predicted DsbA family dithiol-disulfide isomerase
MFANSLAVTEAAECVMEQGREPYEAIAGRLWEGQSEWKGSDAPEAVVRGWVAEIGIDMGRYDSCLSEDRRVQRIAAATTLARQIGVRGTPTFVVLGYPPLQGALPTELFQDILSSVHAEEQRQRAEGAGAGAGN